ncbi:NTP transferase domain-containing protein [Alphaproteobacteria bacterium]|nr:NTP transferase domain-containing protein [Alphaproteobacteria bacterium]
MTDVRIVAVIPAHMASVRFPGKILFPFFDHPMIEHVRRRALLVDGLDDVYVATCDEDIASVVRGYGGKVIMTGDYHRNGTTRVAEAVADIDCSHVLLLQGDEPLLLPRFVSEMVNAIRSNPTGDSWNGTAPLDNVDESDKHSFVKCAIGQAQQIMYCFRRSPSFADFANQQLFIQKIMGIIAYRKEFLMALVELPQTPVETHDFIEQMRIIEHGYNLQAVPLPHALPSVNEPQEADVIVDYLNGDEEQSALLKTIFSDG